jgi:hypothetical protein
MLMCCVCALSLHGESPDVIFGDEPLISDVVLSQLAVTPHVSDSQGYGNHMFKRP